LLLNNPLLPYHAPKDGVSGAQVGLNELPEIHQFLDGFYLSRIGIRILIGQHIALHDPPKEDHIGP
jgi:pyruvate dehydrogenase kinase 2/3/4